MSGPAGLSELEELARAFARGEKTPSVPRDASTVVLLRDPGPEVYLLRRVRGMAFAAGMHVFPGGSVHPDDADADIAWEGPSAAQWGEWFGADERTARALVCAAVRETFEECGVLLAGDPELLADVSTDEWEAERVALEAGEQSMSQLLARRGLVLRADLLRPLAHWITPEVEPKRFDTRFFLAEMPAGQVCRHVGGEADERLWVRPAQAMDDGLTMLPPTWSTLKELASFSDVRSALDAERTVTTVAPKLVVHPDGRVEFRVQ
ncbi:MAG TPA: NUDIX hydrolase [Mycobacteriales bacterium]|nr:NUDIX hydrolase [Mycobacteriales bacterium]